jgi:alpha-glucosidase
VTARRKGNTWYLGGMSAKQSRDLVLPLALLGVGRYRAEIWKDAPDAETNPNHLATESLDLSSDNALRIHVALDGGFVARMTPSAK